MGSTGTQGFIVYVSIIGTYFIAVGYLSKKSRFYLGLILPVLFGLAAFYNWFKPILTPNPYPTMQEATMMIAFGLLSITGFIEWLVIRFLTRDSRNYL